MRTLIVSDLHLGARGGRSVLEDPGCLRTLARAAGQADRLVLLGDVLELRERPVREVLPDALPVLETLAAELPGAAEIALLAGNHDHRLIAPWLARRARAGELGSAADVETAPGDPVDRVRAALGGERTRVLYPGGAMREDVWVTHGHYSDRHTTVPVLERLAAGVMARVVREPSVGPLGTEDYEATLAPVYAWIDAVAEHGADGSGPERGPEGSERAWLALTGRSGGGGLRTRALRAAFPLAIGALNLAGIGPVASDLAGAALRRGPLRAMAEVERRLRVSADWIVFGHTHRAGPLPGDDPAEWVTPSGARLLNTGCWVRETSFVGPNPATSPYRAGFAVWLDSELGRAPELVNLLD